MDKLPVELVVKVLKGIEDLASLDSITRADAVAYRHFKQFPREIVEAVIETDPSCAHIRIIMHHTALICAGKYHVMSMEDFIGDTIFHAIEKQVEDDSILRSWTPWPWTSFDRHVILHMVRTAGAIHRTMVDCISVLHGRFRELQPKHPADQCFRYNIPAKVNSDVLNTPTWVNKPKTITVKKPQALVPLWSEEQRVARAFWHIQMVYELKLAGAQGRLNWSQEDLKHLTQIYAVKPVTDKLVGTTIFRNRYRDTRKVIWNRGLRGLDPAKQVYTFYAYNDPYRDHYDMYLAPDNGPSEFEEIVSVMEYVRETHGDAWADAFSSGNKSVGQIPTMGTQQCSWPIPQKPTDADELVEMNLPTPACTLAWRILRDLDGRVDLDMYFPLQFLGLQPFLRLGFAFWSEKTMVSYGLLGVGHGLLDSKYQFAWQSVLTEDEQQAMEDECCKRLDVSSIKFGRVEDGQFVWN